MTLESNHQKLRLLLKLSILVAGIAFVLAVIVNSSRGATECEDSEKSMSVMEIENIAFMNSAGKIIKIDSYVANDPDERAAGYQHICEKLINETTILFAYSIPVNSRFHMNNVKLPLEIGFFDSGGKLVQVMTMDTYGDGNRRIYGPGQPFQYALEARVGFFEEHNLSAGKSRLVVHSLND